MAVKEPIEALNLVFFANRSVLALCDFVETGTRDDRLLDVCRQVSSLFRNLATRTSPPQTAPGVSSLLATALTTRRLHPHPSDLSGGSRGDDVVQWLNNLADLADQVAAPQTPSGNSREAAKSLLVVLDDLGNSAAHGLVTTS